MLMFSSSLPHRTLKQSLFIYILYLIIRWGRYYIIFNYKVDIVLYYIILNLIFHNLMYI